MRDSLVVSVGMRPMISLEFSLYLIQSFQLTKTSQCVDTINVHRTTSANTLTATPSECQSRVHLVLDPDQCIQHHGSSLVQIERVRLHLGLRCWLIWVPSVNVEGLGLGILLRLRLLDCRSLALRNRLASCIGHDCLGGFGNGVASMCVVDGGKAAGEECGPYGYDANVSKTQLILS
jgi:hypothetical protein